MLRALPALKKRLGINIELAAPDEFIPELPGWRERCIFIGREGKASFFHYDLYAQALAKIERGHTQDLFDVEHMLADELTKSPSLASQSAWFRTSWVMPRMSWMTTTPGHGP